MMYQKAMMFGDVNIAHAILLTGSPKEQKDLGRMVSNYNDAIWSAKRVDIMVEETRTKRQASSPVAAAAESGIARFFRVEP